MNWQVILVVIAIIVGGFFVINNSNDDTNNTNTNSSETTNNTTSELSTISKLIERGEDIRCTYEHTDESGNRNAGVAYFSNMRMFGDFMVTQENGQELQSNVLNLGDTQYVWGKNTGQGFKLNTASLDGADGENEDSSVAVDDNEEFDFSCAKWTVNESMFEVPTNVNFVDNTELINSIESQVETVVEDVCAQLSDPAQRAACEQAVN